MPNLGNSVSQADVPTGVTAISSNDVWASGVEFTGCQAAGDPCLTDVSGTFCLRTLALHTTSG